MALFLRDTFARRLRVAGIIMMPIGSLIAIAIFGGRIESVEFNAGTLELRESVQYVIPIDLLGVGARAIPVAPPYRSKTWQTPFATFLLKSKCISSRDGIQWQFVTGSRPMARIGRTALSQVVDALGYSADEGRAWHVWSEAHPKMAAMLWGRVIFLVRDGQSRRARDILRSVSMRNDLNPETLAELFELDESIQK